MFKFIAFVTILAVASAGVLHAPTHLEIREPSHVEVREHSLAKVGEVVENIPTAVSGYSTSIVHDHANIVTPIIAKGVKTRFEPAFRTYEAPILTKTVVAAPAPILKTIESRPVLKTFESAPIFKSFETAPILKSYESAPILKSFESAPIFKSYESAPILKSYESTPILRSYESAPILKSFETAPHFRSFEAARLPLGLARYNTPLTYAARAW